MRPLRIHHAVPLLLLAAAALTGGPAQAADGPVFQYLGQDDQVHGLPSPKGCVEAEGGGTRAVTNRTRSTATLYQGPRCTGRAVGVLRPGAIGQVRPNFASVGFRVTR
ncbi:hypothetical protein ACGFYU_07935 [Streptomyces sp. NPDC048337]|uniref:hypothetical protein n=1 Tax=Streptomyces sp. NPDC048337 TaxID=3365535 RepID=UPI00371C5CD0